MMWNIEREDVQRFKRANGYTLDLEQKLEFEGHTLYRVKDAEGRLGGWVESLYNVGQYSYVEGEAKVFGNVQLDLTLVKDNAIICDNAYVSNGEVSGDAQVRGQACIKRSHITDKAQVSGSVKISNYSSIGGASVVTDQARITNSEIYDWASVGGWCVIEDSKVFGHARVNGDAKIKGLHVCDDAQVGGGFKIPTDIWLRGNYKSPRDLFIAWTQGKDGYWYEHQYTKSTGCFMGGYTLEKWINDAPTDLERVYREATAEYLKKIANLPVIES